MVSPPVAETQFVECPGGESEAVLRIGVCDVPGGIVATWVVLTILEKVDIVA
jgi:hypothetical protein